MIMKLLKKYVVLILIIMLHMGITMDLFGNSSEGNAISPDRKRGDEPPTLIVDNTPSTANTGETFNFSANFSDDFTVSEVDVNYSYDGNLYQNISMNFIIQNMWNGTLKINQSASTLYYYYFYIDNASNTNTSQVKQITVIDTIPPVSDAGEDVEALQFTNLWLNGSGSEDNRGIVNYTWFWWCPFCHMFKYGYGETVNMSMLTYSVENVTMNLTVKDAAGNEDIDTMNITIIDREPPIANTGDDLYIVDQFQLVYFNAFDSWDNVGITNYTWIFYDNNTLINLYGISVTYSFSLPGDYNITLRVIDGRGNIGPRSWDTIQVIVLDISPPTADAGMDLVIDQRMTVVFNGSGSTEDVDYFWNFTHNGVMQYLFGVSPKFKFHTAGVYLVTLNVSDWADRWNTDTMTVTVLDIDPPVAKAGKDQEILLGESFELNAKESWDLVAIVNYSWSFHYNGTDHILYGEKMTFVFDVMGVYNITLQVVDESGNIGTDLCKVTTIDNIKPLVDAGFDIIIDEGGIAYMNGNRTTDHSPIANYSWTFTYNGKEYQYYGVEFSFQFEIPGVYNVFLFVKDIWGYPAYDELLVRVIDVTPPTADAGENITTTEGKTVVLNASGYDNVGIDNYSWSFYYNEGEIKLFGKVAAFIFELAGNYTVYLEIRDEEGNLGNDSIWVNVSPLLADDYSDDDLDDDNDDESTKGSNKYMIMIGLGILVLLVVIYLVISISKRPKGSHSSLSKGNTENEIVDEIDDEEEVAGDVEDEGVQGTDEKGVKETEEESVKETEEKGVKETEEESVKETDEGVQDIDEKCVKETEEGSVKETEEKGVKETDVEGVKDDGKDIVLTPL